MAAGELEYKEKEVVKAEKVEETKEEKKEETKEEKKEETKKEEKKTEKVQQTNGLAIAGLVCSLVFFIPLTGLIGLILSIVALSQQKTGLYTDDSKVMAIVGIIVSTLRIAIVVFVFFITFVIIGGIASLAL